MICPRIATFPFLFFAMKSTHAVLLWLSLFATNVMSACFFPNGDTVDDTPCKSGDGNSTCCGPGYACLSNGLCAVSEYLSFANFYSWESGWFVRGSCTDKSWTDPACPQFCRSTSD